MNVELIADYKGDEFSSAGNFKKDILNIISVHPIRINAVANLIDKDKVLGIISKLQNELEC